MTGENAIYVEGIGHIGQYLNYMDCLWEKGIIYFVRDYYCNEIELKLSAGISAANVRPLINAFNTLNSNIVAYEKAIGLQEWHRRHQISQNSTTNSGTRA